MKDKDLENIKLLMLDNLDLALVLIKGQGWDLKEVLMKLWNEYKVYRKEYNYSDELYRITYAKNPSIHLHEYDNHISIWYNGFNYTEGSINNALTRIIKQLISDNRWNT